MPKDTMPTSERSSLIALLRERCTEHRNTIDQKIREKEFTGEAKVDQFTMGRLCEVSFILGYLGEALPMDTVEGSTRWMIEQE